MYRYRPYDPDGNEAGEAAYALPVAPGETIIAAGAHRFRVLDVVPVDEENSLFVGLLKVEATAPALH